MTRRKETLVHGLVQVVINTENEIWPYGHMIKEGGRNRQWVGFETRSKSVVLSRDTQRHWVISIHVGELHG
jgi:hypothetical protein